MKHTWAAYAIVAFLSVAAGVAVAGLPGSGSADPTIVVTATTTVVASSDPTTTLAPVESQPPEASTTTSEATTTTTEATTTTTTTEPAPVLPDRSELDVIVANGANIGGIASATSDTLEELGYVDVRATDGTEIVFFSIVYYEEGFQAAAERLAVDLALAATSIGPIGDAPDIIGELQGENLLVYLGSDQA